MTLSEAVRGRYLAIYLNDTGALHLCEVEVCAESLSRGQYIYMWQQHSSCANRGDQRSGLHVN